ncbi:EpsG family protein [Capnocytophaga canimorsus]|nr:EpsG family protein [Capnocytophaga canimorsus]MDT9500129.1 EpsG family protein [Capnocytophaga canimorsus]
MQQDKNNQFILLVFFILISLIMRVLVDVEINKDFFAYYNLYNFQKPENWWEYFLKEPYLYLLYSFFYNFYDEKIEVFQAMYFFNYAALTFFFTWLMTLRDVVMWKKVLIFTMYYFLFSYTLIRNGIPYAIFGYFIYQIYRNKSTKLIYLTPFMHISSSTLLLLIFHKHRKYMAYLLVVCISSLLIASVGSTILNRAEFILIASKINDYGFSQKQTGIFHYIYFGFIVMLSIITWIFVKKRFWNPVITTTLLFYLIGFFINPVVGFRFSPYLIVGILFMNIDISKYKSLNGLLNIGSLILAGYFVFTLYDTHYF